MPPNYSSTEAEARQWATFLHLSLLAGFVLPGAGFVLPLVLWQVKQVKKNERPGIDAHGKVVANWLISATSYAVVCGLLNFLLIGLPLLAILVEQIEYFVGSNKQPYGKV